ncbi:superoxide dismutase family protein [Cohnella sp. REN36]|uniref:superoxide dismutase family protein n=1 Tax=Cohnella sp. REN36 TaxID=2887347 RepID=UPI001D13CB1D|nr:superoxide dismutase family protein [Cohnella sp. REN36]MCC3371607.1 superoxide dismutase family protein [Cohnella sp. REN36]
MNKRIAALCMSAVALWWTGSAILAPTADARSETSPVVKVKIINAKGEEVGQAQIAQVQGAVRIHLEAKHLPPGAHGIHIHETGRCDPPDFKSAGEHLNPEKKQHGFHNPKGFHAGDLPNIQVAADGTVSADLESKNLTLAKGAPHSLLKPGGTAIVIHEKADDYVTDPSGNSGNRIACGRIS